MWVCLYERCMCVRGLLRFSVYLTMFRFALVFGDVGVWLVGGGVCQEMCGLCVFAVSRGL